MTTQIETLKKEMKLKGYQLICQEAESESIGYHTIWHFNLDLNFNELIAELKKLGILCEKVIDNKIFVFAKSDKNYEDLIYEIESSFYHEQQVEDLKYECNKRGIDKLIEYNFFDFYQKSIDTFLNSLNS